MGKITVEVCMYGMYVGIFRARLYSIYSRNPSRKHYLYRTGLTFSLDIPSALTALTGFHLSGCFSHPECIPIVHIYAGQKRGLR